MSAGIAPRIGRVDLDRLAEDDHLATLEGRGGRLRAEEAAEGVQSEAVGRHAHAALLELGALPVERTTRGELANVSASATCSLSRATHAHQHDGEGADAPLVLGHGAEELRARPRVLQRLHFAEREVDVAAVGALPSPVVAPGHPLSPAPEVRRRRQRRLVAPFSPRARARRVGRLAAAERSAVGRCRRRRGRRRGPAAAASREGAGSAASSRPGRRAAGSARGRAARGGSATTRRGRGGWCARCSWRAAAAPASADARPSA